MKMTESLYSRGQKGVGMFYEIASSKTSLIFQDDNGAIYVTCKWSESAGSYCIMALACLVDKTQPIF